MASYGHSAIETLFHNSEAVLQAHENTPSDMNSQITVRSARHSDAEDLHAILLCPNVRLNTLQMPHMPLSKIKQQLENPRPGDAKLVAVFENRVIGTVGIHVDPNPARRHAAGIGIAVHDEFQGLGVGTCLLQEAIDLAERWMGLRRLELEVFSHNTRALELYKRHRFEVEGRLKEYVFRDGEFVDAIAMARVNGLERFSKNAGRAQGPVKTPHISENLPIDRIRPSV